MQAVLYVGHGSRIKAGVEEAIRFIERSQAIIDVPIQEICFLELAVPGVDEGITKCVERGATKIAVVPILLLTAGHANEDIPFEIEVGKIMYPDVEFTYGRAFGIHPKIVDSLYDRVIEQQLPIAEDAQVLLVGRGSSDPAVKRDLTAIAQLFGEKYSFKKVDVCFLYGASPSFDEALLQQQQSATKQVFIIPYLLFTGILMNGIEKKIAQELSSDQQFVLCENLGYHKNIQDVLVERVKELLEKAQAA
ncbi:sirohydrochlorin chelatase [Sporosarcina limicola]|uniref:Sirohydrochlorin ferrochelatase n=1 Tax=Sporosarcina limicola TaxID=34101 RepID=A0A927RDT7_9BACL|nr:sirohydrochlorin chelatase [Sporosarcina limicola]MBE1553952.1 sirohydrochlorin ferrochelatase [Sporosarcina limicola]